ncbi:MAG TPA: methyltransferase domain-containing protein [Firmicutes bacterium]|nr:methyltransferase domain-containing protein [Bacillota bacterium]
MPHKFPAERAERLHDQDRRAGLDPRAVVAELGVAPKENVLDVGAGSGFFTLVLAEAVGPEGTVIAAEVSPEMLEALRKRASAGGWANIRYVPSEEQVVPLADASVDRALLVDVLHEAENPRRLLQEAVRAVRRGGEVTVIEWGPGEGPPGPPAGARLSETKVRAMLAEAGLGTPLKLASVPLPHFGFRAAKPEEPAAE